MKKTKEEDRKKLNKEGLVETFASIDGRISDLHGHSSEVFLQLNAYLKDYYSKINIISENASRIFASIIGDDQQNLLDQLDLLYNGIRDYKVLAESENRKGTANLNEINNLVSFLMMDIRNLNQNLITLKYLITNYKLVSSYELSDLEAKSNIQQWFDISEKIHPHISKAVSEMDKLRVILFELLNSGKADFKDSSRNITELSDDIKGIYRTFIEKNQQSEHYFPMLKEKTAHSSESIGNIITHLQYHDIIRQKIEHIQQSHLKIINMLRDDDTLTSQNQDTSSEIVVGHIADIVALQAEQLILVSKEYQNALKVITHNFRSIAEDTSSISRISNEFSSDDRNAEITLLKKIKMKLDQGIVMLDSNKITLIHSDLLRITDQVSKIKDIITSEITEPLVLMEKEKLLKSGKDLSLKGENPKILGIIYLIYNLAEDLSNNRRDLILRLNELCSLNMKLKEPLADIGLGSISEQEQIRLMVKITQVLNKLDDDNAQLDSVLQENDLLNADILEKIEGTINKVDYYDLFEKVINDVIDQLNFVNSNLTSGDASRDRKITKDSLKDIESFYTVASERLIHNKYIGEEEGETPEEKGEEDDLELF